MVFRKLQYKNVNATRSTQVIGEGEVAVDPDTKTLYIGDGSTAGGVELNTYKPFTIATAEHDASVGERIYSSGTFDINLPSTPEAGDWFEVYHSGTGSVEVQLSSPQIITGEDRWIFVYDGSDWNGVGKV
jgi:hypothetical protein